jgi:hypothetical protein
MSMTPKQWYDFHQKVVTVYTDFVTRYGGDTGSLVGPGGIWISADSGFLADGAVEAERLRVLSAAHQSANLYGNALAHDSNNLLRKMGRGTSLLTDTGKQGGSA